MRRRTGRDRLSCVCVDLCGEGLPPRNREVIFHSWDKFVWIAFTVYVKDGKIYTIIGPK